MSIPRAPKPTFVPNPTTRLCHVCAPLPAFPRTSRPRVCAPSSAFLRTSSPTSAHLRPYSDLPAAPRLRTFAPNPTIRLCPVCAPSPVSRPPSRPRPAHFRAQPHDPALPRLRTFARIPTHEPPHACALSCPTPRSGFAPPAHPHPLFYVLFHPLLRTSSPASMYLFDKSLKGFIQII